MATSLILVIPTLILFEMTEQLTIKDLNCSTCPIYDTIKCPYWKQVIESKFEDIVTTRRLKDIVSFTGCCYHPLALQVLAKPIIVELEKEHDLSEHNRDHTDNPHGKWQKIASPVWMDIKQGNTLQRESARTEEDERHICPLQLDVIERCIELWTNPGDVVFDPFLGIGSTCYQAVKMGRKAYGIELKPSYYEQAVSNMAKASMDANTKQQSLNGFMVQGKLTV
jgi:hypothetical protein